MAVPSHAELEAENQRLRTLLASISSLAVGGTVDIPSFVQQINEPNVAGLEGLAPQDKRRVVDRILGRYVYGRPNG